MRDVLGLKMSKRFAALCVLHLVLRSNAVEKVL
jgi:hypothetical protein